MYHFNFNNDNQIKSILTNILIENKILNNNRKIKKVQQLISSGLIFSSITMNVPTEAKTQYTHSHTNSLMVHPKQSNVKKYLTVVKGVINFKAGGFKLTPAMMIHIDDVLKQIPKNSKIITIGHTDSTGTVNSNYSLGLKRAQAVALYLKFKGFHVIKTKSSGEKFPISHEHDYLNRRVDIALSYHAFEEKQIHTPVAVRPLEKNKAIDQSKVLENTTIDTSSTNIKVEYIERKQNQRFEYVGKNSHGVEMYYDYDTGMTILKEPI